MLGSFQILSEDIEPETPPPAQWVPKPEPTPSGPENKTPQEPLPVAPKASECGEPKFVSINTDGNKSASEADISKPAGEISQLAFNLQDMRLDDKTQEYVQNLSNRMIEEATLPFTAALANSIACGVNTSPSAAIETSGELRESDVKKDDESEDLSEQVKSVLKHDSTQSRSSVLERDIPVQHQQTDPVLDAILDTCASESDKLDAAHSDTLHMPERPGVPIAKSVKFARPYYFDVVTLPHNGNQELTIDADSILQFVSKIRSRNMILPSKNISVEQLNAIVTGKQFWCENGECSSLTDSLIPFFSSSVHCRPNPFFSNPG